MPPSTLSTSPCSRRQPRREIQQALAGSRYIPRRSTNSILIPFLSASASSSFRSGPDEPRRRIRSASPAAGLRTLPPVPPVRRRSSPLHRP
jgi:hypothetical protein